MKRTQTAGVVVGLACLSISLPAAGQPDRAASQKATTSAPPAAAGITAQQRAMLDEKLALIRQIVQAAEPDMQANAVPSEGHRWLLDSLFSMSLSDVRALGVPGSFEGTSRAMAAVKARSDVQPKLGQPTTELVYYPILPCRYIDTRFGGGGIVSGARQFDIDLGGSSHGGSGACNPVSQAGIGGTSSNGAAIAMNVAILGPTSAPGFMGARPVGSTNTTSLVNWYEAGPSVQASNWGVVTYDQQAMVTNEIEFFGGPAHVIVDVFGIFGTPTVSALACQSVYGPGVSVDPGIDTCADAPACPAGSTATAPLFDNSTFGGLVISQMNLAAPGLDICGRNTSTSARSFLPGVRCCSTPGR